MTERTVGWFDVREKYCSLADKPWLISQIRQANRLKDNAPLKKKERKRNWLFIDTQKQASQKLYARIKHTLQSLSWENFSKTKFFIVIETGNN